MMAALAPTPAAVPAVPDLLAALRVAEAALRHAYVMGHASADDLATVRAAIAGAAA